MRKLVSLSLLFIAFPYHLITSFLKGKNSKSIALTYWVNARSLHEGGEGELNFKALITPHPPSPTKNK